MRLAQISRKVKVKPTEIRKFIKDEFDVELDKDPNIKIDDEQVDAILEHFKIEEVVEEVKEEAVVAVVEEEEIEIDPSIDTDLESLKEVVEEATADIKIEIPDIVQTEVIEEVEAAAEEVATKEVEKKVKAEEPTESEDKRKKVGIQHATEEELAALKAKRDEEESTEFKSVEVDENAELIGAEIEKLEGLKVVGKIELEDDKETKKLLKEVVELPSTDAIEDEIDALDGEVDTSEFTELGEGETDEAKDAIFAELDAQMENTAAKKVKKVKPVVAETAKEVSENVDESEDSMYKDSRGIYHFSSVQKANRRKSIAERDSKRRAKAAKEKKARHYKEKVAKVAAPPQKKKAPSKKTEAKQAAKIKKEEAPKSLWGKFVNWINDRN